MQKLLVEVTTFLHSVCSWCYLGVKYHLETPYTSGRYEAAIIIIQYDMMNVCRMRPLVVS